MLTMRSQGWIPGVIFVKDLRVDLRAICVLAFSISPIQGVRSFQPVLVYQTIFLRLVIHPEPTCYVEHFIIPIWPDILSDLSVVLYSQAKGWPAKGNSNHSSVWKSCWCLLEFSIFFLGNKGTCLMHCLLLWLRWVNRCA